VLNVSAAPARPDADAGAAAETGGTPVSSGSNNWPYALLAGILALAGAGGALVAVRSRR
jgi:hypothetical protein